PLLHTCRASLRSFLLYYSAAHPPLPSFPTRRSSDLARRERTPRARPPHPRADAARDRQRARRQRVADLQRPQEADEHDRRQPQRDRKSTRLNSSHVAISYAVFCLKKKKNKKCEQLHH